MAITESELEISNKSYTNKDFPAIFTELMSIATKISNRFDPTSTNETDPFIILLKLLAFVGDKICYQVDKNILERFILSCTQDKSMRELTEMLGYTMHYYRAASTDVYFSYTFPEDLSINSILIPAFSTVVDTDNNIQYITTTNTSIDKETGTSSPVEVLQGVLKQLTILGSTTIQLENLDSHNRLYFPEIMVAENGVFVTQSGVGSDIWENVDNLNTQEYNAYCYKFNFDSSVNLPYIEFPEWINNIIGSGLEVKYLITDGEAGNVRSKSLTQLQRLYTSQDEASIEDSSIKVINNEAALNGMNPETIDEAYQGFQRTIGTFDTLVTCRDYANAIYNELDSNNNYIVSNVQVSDRRNDINYSSNVVTYTETGTTTKSFIEKTAEGQPIITPYELCLYPLKPIKESSFSVFNKAEKYKESFTRLADTSVIENYIEDSKTASHNYKILNTTDIFAIKNYYKLEAIISTTTKVNVIEQNEILVNINEALIKAYNARNVNFGDALAYDNLLSTIENADNRIKSVSLYEPEVTPVFYMANGQEVAVEDNTGTISNQFKAILSKNILSGKVSLFDYDTTFDYKYGQAKVSNQNMLNENVAYLTTNTNIGNISTDYTLKANEVIQFIAPNYISDVIYPYGVNYYLKLSNANKIDKDTEYKLSSGETLVLQYKDVNDNIIIVPYGAEHIIKPNFDLYTSAYKKANGQTPTKYGVSNNKYPTEYIDKTVYFFYTISTKEEIAHRTINEAKVDTTKYCYWHLNSSNNQIPWNQISQDTSYSYVLEEGEYFFSMDVNLNSIVAYGSGTSLTITGNMRNWNNDWTINKINDITELINDGISSFKDDFVLTRFTSDNYLQAIEQQIITLTEGDTIKPDTTLAIADNIFTTLSTTDFKYVFSNETEEYKLPSLGINWKGRALLDINMGPNVEQVLEGNQTIIGFDKNDDEIFEATSDNVLQSSVLKQLNGGTKVDITYTDLSLQKIYPSIYLYEDIGIDLAGEEISSIKEHYYKINFENTNEYRIVIPNIGKDAYIMFYTLNEELDNSLKLEFAEGIERLERVNSIQTELDYTIYLSQHKGISIIKIPAASFEDLDSFSYLNITYSSTNEETAKPSIIMSDVRFVDNINKYLYKNNNLTLNDLISFMKIEYPDSYKNFYQSHYLDTSKEIELSTDNTMDKASVFFDANNITNKWTIPQIDFEHSRITIARSSIK